MWSGETFQSVATHTNDIGKAYAVRAQRTASGLNVERNDAREVLPGSLLPSSHWNMRQIGQSSLLNTQYGTEARVQVAPRRARESHDGKRLDRRRPLPLFRRCREGSMVRRSRPLGQDHIQGFRRIDDRVHFAGMTPADRFAHLPDLLAADSDLLRRGRWVTVDCRIDIGNQPFFLAIENGVLAAFERGPRLMRSSAFTVRASDEAWTRHWQPVPEPGWHDLFALTKRGAASMEGDFRPLLQNLQFFKDLLALPRIVQ